MTRALAHGALVVEARALPVAAILRDITSVLETGEVADAGAFSYRARGVQTRIGAHAAGQGPRVRTRCVDQEHEEADERDHEGMRPMERHERNLLL